MTWRVEWTGRDGLVVRSPDGTGAAATEEQVRALLASAADALAMARDGSDDDPCALGGAHVDDWSCDGESVRCRRCGMAFGSAEFWRRAQEETSA